jgi:hypothetical protein
LLRILLVAPTVLASCQISIGAGFVLTT